MRFCEASGIPPSTVGETLRHLPSGDTSYESSI
ncbi:hypothetical protein ABID44_000398 [Aquamicrobium ahrensii]|uniref:Uncharacterized protein n=2 Tax=Aquamicrobium ahrensii TaxID=469551 RepID=A0ABV2KJ57_9HYPH